MDHCVDIKAKLSLIRATYPNNAHYAVRSLSCSLPLLIPRKQSPNCMLCRRHQREYAYTDLMGKLRF